MGIAFGAIALRLSMVLHSDGSGVPTMAAVHLAFGLVGLVAVAALIDVIGLPSNAGAEMSGHGTRARASVAARDEMWRPPTGAVDLDDLLAPRRD